MKKTLATLILVSLAAVAGAWGNRILVAEESDYQSESVAVFDYESGNYVYANCTVEVDVEVYMKEKQLYGDRFEIEIDTTLNCD